MVFPFQLIDENHKAIWRDIFCDCHHNILTQIDTATTLSLFRHRRDDKNVKYNAIIQTPHFEMDNAVFHLLKIDKDTLELIFVETKKH